MPQMIASSQGTSSMAYDETGHRVRRTTPTGRTYYLNPHVELNAAGMTRNYWAGDQLIARRDPTGKVSYLLQDRLDSTRVVTDDSGAVTGRYDYEPYGTPNPNNLADGASQLWQGQRSDDDSGLIYMNARYYDPELGQFTAPDSLIPDVYQPQTLNRYAIDNNDPVNRVDPSGHMSMRVELKKEQEYQGLRFATMYLGALLGGCVAGGGLSETTCPSITIPDFTVFRRRECEPNCPKPVDKKSKKTTQVESVVITTKVAAETVSNDSPTSKSPAKKAVYSILRRRPDLLFPKGTSPEYDWILEQIQELGLIAVVRDDPENPKLKSDWVGRYYPEWNIILLHAADYDNPSDESRTTVLHEAVHALQSSYLPGIGEGGTPANRNEIVRESVRTMTEEEFVLKRFSEELMAESIAFNAKLAQSQPGLSTEARQRYVETYIKEVYLPSMRRGQEEDFRKAYRSYQGGQ
jgi:RHS repeat-associated protein